MAAVANRIVLTSVVAVVALGILGAVSGPVWRPTPMTDELTVTVRDTTVRGGPATDAPGTYEVREAVTTVELNGATVEARISMPIGAEGERPGMVFVHGAGTGRYDEAFVTQARELASAGVVAMVPDKRLDTYTDRHRDYVRMANDYLRSVAVLREWPGVDPDRVGVYGESEGAWIVPVMAADNAAVDFVALVAAPVVPPRQQAAFAVDSYLRNTGVPSELLRSIPRVVGMTIPGGGFEYTTFDVSPFQERMRQPVFLAYGTGDAAMPTVQGPLQVISDMAIGGNDDYTLRYYEDADHGIKVRGALVPEFARDLAAWVQGLPGTAGAEPQIAGAQPDQRFRAEPVDRPAWYADGPVILTTLVLALVGLLAGPVLLLWRRLRGNREPVVADGVRAPLIAVSSGAVVTFAALVAYLLVVADMARSYRTNVMITQGGGLVIRLLGIAAVVAAVVLGYRMVDGVKAGTPAAALTWQGWVTLGGSLLGSGLLLLLLGYFGVFPPVW